MPCAWTIPTVYKLTLIRYLALISTSCLTGCRGSLHFSLLSTRHVVRAALSTFPCPLMCHPTFPALYDALYFLFWLNATLRHSLGLGITPQRIIIKTPPSSVICLVWTSYCSLLTTLLFFYLCYFPSLCAQTICTLFGCNRRRAHGPPSTVYKQALVRYLALISTSCHTG